VEREGGGEGGEGGEEKNLSVCVGMLTFWSCWMLTKSVVCV
jgi:hypothetical protein